jgi:hypothetical protein
MWNDTEGSKMRNDTDADMEMKHDEAPSEYTVSGAYLNPVPEEYGARVLTVPSQCLVKDDRKQSFVKQNIILAATKRSIR